MAPDFKFINKCLSELNRIFNEEQKKGTIKDLRLFYYKKFDEIKDDINQAGARSSQDDGLGQPNKLNKQMEDQPM